MSIGLSRLFAALVANQQKTQHASPAIALIAIQERAALGTYIQLANQLREEGLKIELYLEHKKLVQQFKYADKKKIPFIITANQQELDANIWVLRNLTLHQESRVPLPDLLLRLTS
jgi:histidyl-tRNA synthetase